MKFRHLLLLLFLLVALPAWAITLDQLDALIANFEVDKAETELRTLLQSEPENPEYLKRMGFV